MGFGKSEQIYKEATKQKLIHVEDEQTKQSQKQGQSQPGQMQQKKTDLLENVMQKYQENASQVDLSEVKKDQSADMEEQIVVTTSIHETKNAELILEGEQLSKNKQEQIDKAEQEMKETESSQLKEKEEAQDPTSELLAIHKKFRIIKASFDEDTDSSSQTYTQVKTTLNSLLEAMGKRKMDRDTLSDALLACRNAAVHYYNTHRGHRWSEKGKRRKDLVNRLVDATHEAIINEELTESVRDKVISAMLLDTSDTGYESKKSKEFFCAQAKKESGRANADEYSYQIRYTNRLMEKWHEIDANRPLELVAEKILKYEIKPEVLTPEYIKRHYAELMRIMVSAENLQEAGILYGDMSFFHEQLEKRILFFRALFKQCDRVAQHAGVDGEQYQSEEQRIALIKTKTKLHISTSSLIANAFDIRNAGRILGYDNAQPDRIKGMSKSATLKYFGIENLTLEQKNALDERLKTNFTDTERNEDSWSDYEEDNNKFATESERRKALGETLSEYETRYNRSLAQADENKALADIIRGDVELAEIRHMLTEYNNIDLMQYEKLTPELISQKYDEMKIMFAKSKTIMILLQNYPTYVGDLDQTMKNKLLIQANYLAEVEREVNLWMAVLTDLHYDGEDMRKFCRYTDKELRAMSDQQTDPGLQEYYQNVHQLIKMLRRPDNSWDAYLKQELEKNKEKN